MNISQPEPEDPALTPVHASDPSPTELLKAALSSDAPLAERFSPHEFAACASAAHADGDAEAIARAARRCFSSAPPKQLRSWATHLLCCRVAQNDGPFGLLAKLAETNQRACGHVFAAGDIAWNCRTCQKDNTCVLCDACVFGPRTTRATRSSSTRQRRAGVATAGTRRHGSPRLLREAPSVFGRRGGSSIIITTGVRQAGEVVVREAARYVVGLPCGGRCARTLQLEPGLLDDGTERGDGVVG